MADYYVRPTNGLDTNPGTSFRAAFQTTQRAIDTVRAGDHVYLRDEADETQRATIDFNSTTAGVTTPIDFIGCDSLGSPYNGAGKYTISGTSLGASTNLFTCGAGAGYFRMIDIETKSATQHGWDDGSGAKYMTWNRCRFGDCSGDGFYSTSTTSHHFFVECDFDGNTGSGFDVNATGRGNVYMLGCRFFNNGDDGLHCAGDFMATNIIGCIMQGNTGVGARLDGLMSEFTGNTVEGNSSDGLQLSTTMYGVVANNSFYDNGGYGIDFGAGVVYLVRNNHYHSNTSGEWSSGSSTEDGKQTGDPKFSSVASADYTPLTGSPLIQGGVVNAMIGAIAHTDGGGGGGSANLLHGKLG